MLKYIKAGLETEPEPGEPAGQAGTRALVY